MLSTILGGLAVATMDVMDVQHYRLDVHVDPIAKSLRGDVEIRVQVVSTAATELTLDLSQALVVDGVKVNGKPARFTHENDRIRIAAGVSQRGPVSLLVSYHGTPQGNACTFADHEVPIIARPCSVAAACLQLLRVCAMLDLTAARAASARTASAIWTVCSITISLLPSRARPPVRR